MDTYIQSQTLYVSVSVAPHSFFFLAKFFQLLSNFRACFFETGGRLVYLLMYEVQEILGRRKRFLVCIFHFIEVLSS